MTPGVSATRFACCQPPARARPSALLVVLIDLGAGQSSSASYDAVVQATGYVRNTYQSLPAPLSAHLGDFTVDRHYRLQTPAHVLPTIFLQGCSESTHGLSDTLLSVTSVRSGKISQVLDEALADFARHSHQALYEEPKHSALAT